jgi:hypothetical protein
MQNKQNPKEGCLGRSFWGGIGALAAIAALIVAIISIPQATLIRQGISQTFSGTPAATESPTSTPSPTPTPQVIPINQTMTCTNCSGSSNYSLIVRSTTIDPAKSQVTLLIGLQNNSTVTAQQLFGSLQLQDLQTGHSTDGVGDGFNEFQITANQLELFNPIFPFIPVTGREYTFSASLYDHTAFSPIKIKF